jgi:hypothetical protein
MQRPSHRSRYANVTATMALVVALGGTSYAAARLPANAVGPTQLRRDAVSSSKIKDGSLRLKDFKAGQVPAGPAGPAGPRGASGAAGPVGPAGVQGPAGPSTLPVLDYNVSEALTIAAGKTTYDIVHCDTGQHVVGGGVQSSGAGMTVDSSWPDGTTGWNAWVRNDANDSRTFTVYVICASTSGITTNAKSTGTGGPARP